MSFGARGVSVTEQKKITLGPVIHYAAFMRFWFFYSIYLGCKTILQPRLLLQNYAKTRKRKNLVKILRSV